MTKVAKPGQKIDKLMDLASRALTEMHYFECERACLEGLELAHVARDYERMARILLPLQECRRQIRLQAVDTGKLNVLNQPLEETWVPKPGCYLIEPPIVAADARGVMDRALREEVPVAVLAREPITKSKKIDARGPYHAWPIVLIGPVTVRSYVRPPKNEKPTMAWFLDACEALGDSAIAALDPELDPFARVEELLIRLHSLRDHEKLHQALEQACRDAMVEAAKPAPVRKNGKGSVGIDPEEPGESDEAEAAEPFEDTDEA